jgi:hypothetical protein
MQSRETELTQQLQERQDRIDLLQTKLDSLGTDKAELQRRLERLQHADTPAAQGSVAGGQERGGSVGMGGVRAGGSLDSSSWSSVMGRSPSGSPLQSVARVAGGLCRKCMSQLTAVDVESALDMAIALGGFFLSPSSLGAALLRDAMQLFIMAETPLPDPALCFFSLFSAKCNLAPARLWSMAR